MTLEIAIRSIRENRPIFPNPLEEPVLYTHLIRVTKQALDELVVVQTGMDAAIKNVTGGE